MNISSIASAQSGTVSSDNTRKQETGTISPPILKSSLPSVKAVTSDKFMIVTQHKLASEAGAKMLRKGGTATDAMIAALMMLNLVTPEATGIGGGGFLLGYEKKNDQVYTLDGRESAPENVKADMFLKKDGDPMDNYQATIGGRSVATPGLLKMLKEAHDRNGKLSWKELFEPAIEAAEKGFPMPERLRNMLIACKGYSRLSDGGKRYLNQDGSVKAKGEKITNPQFAETLKIIADQGIDPFYSGEIAKDIINTVSGSPIAPAVLTLKDLNDYKVIKRDPITVTYHDDKYYTADAPCSGGIAVLQALKLLEKFKLKDRDPSDLKTDHLIFNAERMAYSDRKEYIGDPDFTPNVTKELLSDDYIANRSKILIDDRPLQIVKAGNIHSKKTDEKIKQNHSDKPCTSHMSIIDQDGNAVSMTSSVEYLMGSGLETKGGFILNNSMTDFDFNPTGKNPNEVRPNKRPNSAMAPIISFSKDGKIKSVIGSPGGSHIVGFVLPRLIQMHDWGMKPETAITSMNIIAPEPEPKLIIEEQFAKSEKAKEYMRNGYAIKASNRISGVNVVENYNGLLTGVADPRREGGAVGE